MADNVGDVLLGIMMDRAFDVKLIPKLDSSVTRQAVTEWIEKANFFVICVELRRLNMFFP